MQALMKSLNELCDALPFQTSFYVKDLTTGARGDRFGSVPVPSASTRKISILMAALAAVHAGKLTLDQKVTIESKYQDNDSGTFQHLTPGFSITLRDAMVMMIIVSDNTCTGIVVDRVGLGEIQRWCESIGMTGTTHRFGIPPEARPRPHPRAGDHHHAQRSGAPAGADPPGHDGRRPSPASWAARPSCASSVSIS